MKFQNALKIATEWRRPRKGAWIEIGLLQGICHS